MQERTAERDAIIAERDVARAEVETFRASAQTAVGKFRDAVIAADGSLAGVADLITGDSIEAVETAVERAKGIVAKVREQVEMANAGRSVPNGGTTRQPLDTSGMSAAEKLRLGVAQKIGA